MKKNEFQTTLAEQIFAKSLNGIKKDLEDFIKSDSVIKRAKVVFTHKDNRIHDKYQLVWKYGMGLDIQDLNPGCEDLYSLLGHTSDYSIDETPCLFIEDVDVSGVVKPGENWMLIKIPKLPDDNIDKHSPFYWHRNLDISTFNKIKNKFITNIYKGKNYKYTSSRVDRKNQLEYLNNCAKDAIGKIFSDEIDKFSNNNSSYKYLRYLVRAIDYYAIFQGYDYLISYGLIVGGFHLATFYHVIDLIKNKNEPYELKKQSNGSTNNNINFGWTSVDELYSNWVNYGEELIISELSVANKKATFFNFLAEIDSIIKFGWSETVNSVLLKIANEESLKGSDVKTVIENCLSTLLILKNIEEGKKSIITSKSSCSFTNNCEKNDKFHVGYINTSSPCEYDNQCMILENIYDDLEDYKNLTVVFKNILDEHRDKDSNKSVLKKMIRSFIGQYENHIKPQRQSLLKTAIISILIDSFSHNISAHSLNAIIWLYLKRLEKLNERLLVKDSNLTKKVLDHSCCKPEEHKRDCTCKVVSTEEIEESSRKAEDYYDKLGLADSTYNQDYFSIQDIFSFANEGVKKKLLDFEGISFSKEHLNKHINSKKIPSIPIPLDNELVPFLSYLNEKSVFWNGVTRDLSSGGIITTWYELIYQFANNPLFLGTIAHSEELHRMTIKIGYNEDPSEFIKINLNALFEDILPPQNDGILSTKNYYNIINEIDNFLSNNNSVRKVELKDQSDGSDFLEFIDSEPLKKSINEISHMGIIYNGFLLYIKNKIIFIKKSYSDPNYKLIKLSEKFAEQRISLSDDKNTVFIPGGVIGKHALYTIFENTLRNIKHTDNEKNGEIVLSIKIEDVDNKPLFKISVWLNNGAIIKDDTKEKIRKSLHEPIITEDGKPKLGGSSQDKICGAMLFNNIFSEVESDKYYEISEGAKIKKPWIAFDVDNINNIVKRSFYLWKGSLYNYLDIVQLSKEKNEIKENPCRFLFSLCNLDKIKEKHLISENGLIRILSPDKVKKNPSIGKLYDEWNKEWIKFKGSFYFVKHSPNKTIYYDHMIKNQEGIWKYEMLDTLISKNEFKDKDIGIQFAHGEVSENSSNTLQYRNHGPLVEHFVRRGEALLDQELNFENRSEGELIETFLTKIDIYDNRIYNRVKEKNKIKLFSESLLLNIFPEECKQNNKGTKPFKKYITESDVNIVIIHLSFIESMEGFNENNIPEFVNQYFNNFLSVNSKLIITTGRGRGLWWDSLKSTAKTTPMGIEHILFKPIDSLLSAFQEGLVYKDDFMVKYNLLKVIFGS